MADRFPQGGIGVIDATGHAKQGEQTPGVQRQYCGETGKIDNCVVAQHLLFSDNAADNPFACMLATDLYLPQAWVQDRQRCQDAGIGREVVYRPKWKIAVDQLPQVRAAGVKLNWVVFDEDYGRVPAFWFALDAMGQAAVGEVPANFRAWAKPPACQSSGYACHAARRVDNLATFSPAFIHQPWQTCRVKDTTRGILTWQYKVARVYLSDSCQGTHAGVPTDRMYWLIVLRQPDTGRDQVRDCQRRRRRRRAGIDPRAAEPLARGKVVRACQTGGRAGRL